MKKNFHTIGLALGRIFLGALFLISAIHKIVDWQATERGLVSLFCDWHAYMSHSIYFQQFFASILPWVPFVLIAATILELLGGLFLVLGFRPRLGALFLICFFIPATILLHPFWFAEGFKKELQTLMFVKNIAILGGLFLVMSVETSWRREKSGKNPFSVQE